MLPRQITDDRAMPGTCQTGDHRQSPVIGLFLGVAVTNQNRNGLQCLLGDCFAMLFKEGLRHSLFLC